MMEFNDDYDGRNNISVNSNMSGLNSFTRSLSITNNQSLIKYLHKIWTNEKFSKELLKYEEEFLSQLSDIIEKKEKECNSMQNSNNAAIRDEAEILELDLERTKFMYKDYLRIRLGKIDKYLYHIIKNDLHHLLSKTEFEFAFESFKLKRNIFSEGINKKISETFNDFKPYPENPDMIVSPPSNSYVIIKSQTSEPLPIYLRDLWEDSNETVTITRDEIFCLPSSFVQ